MQEYFKAKHWIILLFISSVFLLFFNLGYRSLWGSEGRWAEVVRQMLITRDFFHPTINGEPYFDKPLFTYWIIVVFVPIFNELNEFVVRLPSAVSALVAIFCTFFIGKRLFSDKIGILASFLLLTSWGFVFWARTAAADMENLAFILIAVCWYFFNRGRSSFVSYFIFYLICAIGAQFKGLTAIAVPILVVFIDLLISNDIKKHINFPHFIAIIISAVVYFAPFIYAQITSDSYSQQGLYLVFRENLLRFFNAFDHKEPFYVYLFYVPLLILPWIFLLIGFLFFLFKKSQNIGKNEKWLFGASLSIFLLFTASSSRRSYYILPILPFLALCLGIFIEKTQKFREFNIFIELQGVFIFLIAFIETISPLLWIPLLKFFDFDAPSSLKFFTFVSGVFALSPFFIFNYLPFKTDIPYNHKIISMIISSYILFCGFFCFQQNSLEQFRSKKVIALKAQLISRDLPSSYIGISKNMADVSFYLNRKEPVVNLEKKENIATFFLKDGEKILISRKKDLKKFFPYLKKCKKETLISAMEFPWSRRNDKELIVLKILGACK